MREPSLYNAIITAIATGASRMAEISTKVDESTSVCATYLKNLMALGIIRKETPYGEKESRKSIYAIDDNMFRFWYRFVPANSSIIGRGVADLTYRKIKSSLPDYMGKVFEEICKQYLWKLLLNGKCQWNFKTWVAGGVLMHLHIGKAKPNVPLSQNTVVSVCKKWLYKRLCRCSGEDG